MTKEEHIAIHKELHSKLDMLVADMIAQTDFRMLPSKTTVMQLIEWSYEQTKNPSMKDSETYD